MASTSRQTTIFGIEDWKKIYQTYQEADFQSYDFETIRKSFVDYLRAYYPESFNDFVESSEFVALLDVIAFMGQSLAFRHELNSRENFLETAERRESVAKLADLVAYRIKRNEASTGLLKVDAISTTENVLDYNGNNLSTVTVLWDDQSNPDWYEQFVAIMNAMMVDSQRVGRPAASSNILNVDTFEYSLNTVPGSLPVRPFTAKVSGMSMDFEVVSATTKTNAILEAPPLTSGIFNLLYRNDRLGFASPDTGFFLLFKQGVLQTSDVLIKDRIPNRILDIDVTGVNNTDVWVFEANADNEYVTQWQWVDNLVNPPNIQKEEDKNFFTVTTAADDRVSLQFGDGVFSEIPVGALRVYVRSSNGLSYVINPIEMQSVTISMPYISRTSRLETATLTVSLPRAVSNAKPRETLNEIKARAPQRFYSQNRMVNGEDYSNFPFTQYSSIIKSKAINRSTIGASRYLDLVDVTGKYSSTNVFGTDGILYKAAEDMSFSFDWTDLNDIAEVIVNKLEPAIASRGMAHYYYDKNNFTRITPSTPLLWSQSTVQFNETTGFFTTAAGDPQSIGLFAADNRRYLTARALVKFVAPIGYFFDSKNKLHQGEPSDADIVKEYVWATISTVINDGANYGKGALDDGSGPVFLSSYVPTGAQVAEIIPVFVADLPADIEQAITQEILFNRLKFALVFNHQQQVWSIVTNNPDETNWLVLFETDGETYTVKYRTLNYYFASIKETRFYYDGSQRVYDSKTGTVVNDYIRVLKTNSKPGTNTALDSDVLLDIISQPPEDDGHINDYRVGLSFTDSNADGAADDPDFFDLLVNDVGRVFFELQRTADNLVEMTPLDEAAINTDYESPSDIAAAAYNYSVGTLFYSSVTNRMYKIAENVNGQRYLESLAVRGNEAAGETARYVVYTGRSGVQFHYKHNSPASRRIDPGTTNIIDMYVVTHAYYQAYQQYLRDSTQSIAEPAKPTVDELTLAYQGLNDFKMVSDNIVLNSVTFKPLFGSKAIPEMQAFIKVVRNSKVNVSDSEIKSKVVRAINEYFTIEKWEFGDTFYFSELASFLHKELGGIISSAILVPKSQTQKFGALLEIKAAPNEIFVSAITVNDIEVIDTITNGNIRAE